MKRKLLPWSGHPDIYVFMKEETIDNLVKLVQFRVGSDFIYNKEEIKQALILSLSAFNEIPPFSFFTYEDNVERYTDLLVTYAAYVLFVQQSLKEKGKEHTITDNGVTFVPPSLGDFLKVLSESTFEQWFRIATLTKRELLAVNN